MKQLILIPFLLAGYMAYSQAPSLVHDPINSANLASSNAHLASSNAYLAKSVATGVEVADKAIKSLEMLKKAKEKIEKVSNAVRTLNMIGRLVENQAAIIVKVRKTYNDLEQSKTFTPRELGNILNSFNDIVATQQQNINLAGQILQDDVFNMTDSERLKMLMELNSEMASCLNDITLLNNKYKRIKDKRFIQQTFK